MKGSYLNRDVIAAIRYKHLSEGIHLSHTSPPTILFLNNRLVTGN